MKKILGMILGFGLLCSSAVAAEEAQTQEGLKVGGGGKKSSIGWFAGAGMGMVNTPAPVLTTLNGSASMPMFGINLNGGVILPHNENVNHLISADFVYQTLAGYEKRIYDINADILGSPVAYPSNNSTSNGYGIEMTINYNLSYDIYKSDIYTFAMLGGVGLGGAYIESRTERKENGKWVSNGDFGSRGSFIINANLGVRNILFKNHAIDLTLKSRVLEVYSQDIKNADTGQLIKKITKADTNAGFTLMLSYTFLKF